MNGRLGTTFGYPCSLIVIGAGGHGKVVADVAVAAGFNVAGFVDDCATTAPLPGFPLLGCVSDVSHIISKMPRAKVVVAIGDNTARKKVVELLQTWGVPIARVIHPSSVISPFAQIGIGTVILPSVVVNAGAVVGNHVILNTSCSVDHDCIIGDFAHISPGAHLTGKVNIGEGAHVGTGVAVIPGCSVGSWAVVGAGAVVVEDIPPKVVAVGVPAKVVRSL